MASKKNDAIEIDALLVPTLGDMSKVEKQLGASLSKAAKPLVDTLSDAKVGLDSASLRKVSGQLQGLAREFEESFQKGVSTVLSAQNKELRSASGLKQLAKGDSAVAKMVKMLGGYDQAAAILSRPDAQRRLNSMTEAFRGMNDVAFQISKLPAVDSSVQKLLTKLYKGNAPENFKKLTEVQQRQVRDALAIMDLQDQSFRSLKNGLVKAGLGTTAADLNKNLRQRKANAQRLNQVTNPEAMARLARQDDRLRKTQERAQQRIDRQEARSRAVSEEKDRVLRRTGGISGLRDKQDIGAVRAGFNRDYNLATQRAAVAATGTGGKNSKEYKEALAQIESIKGQRRELNALVNDMQRVAAEQVRTQKSTEQAQEKQMQGLAKQQALRLQTDQKWQILQAQHEDKARGKRLQTDQKWQILQAQHEDKARTTSAKTDALWTRMQAQEEDKRVNMAKAAQERWTVESAYAENKRRDQSMKAQEAWAWEQAKWQNKQIDAAKKSAARAMVAPASQVLENYRPARNIRQAQQILRNSGGSYDQLDRSDVQTVRPYLQDRFKARSQYAESVGTKYGSDSPEFARAAASAREYATALDHLNTRAATLRPTIGDLGQVVRSFFRYALGYGALYEALGAVTALGRGLVDLDEQLYNIQAITLSTDSQMRTIEGSIKQVGMTTKFTLNEVAKGAQVLAQAGTAPEAIPKQLRAVADFAAATGSSLEQSADLLTSFKNVYTDISDGDAADMLTKALNLSKLQGEDLRTIVSYTAQTAEGYNVSAEQLLGAVATLRNVGIKPSTIATGLRQAMLEIFNPDAKLLKALRTRYKQMGEDMSDSTISGMFNSFTFADNPLVAAVSELKRIGFGGEASNLFSRAFDVRAFNPLKALVNNFDQFNLLSGQVGVGQSATEGSKIQLESLRATLENLGAAVVAFSDSVGGGMVRSLQAAAEKATDLVQALTELDLKMKSENGTGLMTTIGAGLAGGAVGALLSGRGVLNKVGGFATGAYAAGSVTQTSSIPNGESGMGDYAIPVLAGLVTIVPGIMDFLGGISKRRAEIGALAVATKGLKGVDVGASIGPALTLGAGVADFMSTLGKMKMPKGIGLLGIARIGAGLFARAIPVIGLIWTAYELLNLFSEKGGNQVQAEIDKQRTKAVAAGDRYRSIQGKYDTGQAEINKYRIDDNGQAAAGTTASSAVALQSQAANLSASMQQLFGTNIDGLGQAAGLLREYARRDNDQRRDDLLKINQLTGKNLTDQDVYDVSTQIEQLDKSVDGYRQSLVAQLNSSTDKMREAIAAGNTKDIDEAGAMQRVLAQLPDLRQYLYGQLELDSAKVTELYIQFNKLMAAESEKGAVSAAEVLDAKVKAGAEDVASAALALGDSPAVDNAIQQIIDNLIITEKNTVGALQALSDKFRTKAAEFAASAAKLEAEAKVEGDLGSVPILFDESGMMQVQYRDSAKKKTAEAGSLRQAEAAETAAAQKADDERARQQQADDMARARARAAAAEIESRATTAAGNGTFTGPFMETLSATQRALLAQLQDPAQRTQLAKTGAFAPVQTRTGQYDNSPIAKQIEKILLAAQQYATTKVETDKNQAKEDAKRSMLSNPQSMVQLAQLANQQKAAERRGDYTGAQAAVKKSYDIQYGEQQKAVGRAKIDMDAALADDTKKDATSTVERYNAELAKLESLRGDMADKLDEYNKKVSDMDLKRRTVENQLAKKGAQKEFDEAVDRGEVDKAIAASKEYATIQAESIRLTKEELSAKGYSADQIELEIRTREDLTTTLIDQESAQKRLTSAIIARSEFLMRDVGTGPTTGQKGTDAYIKEAGIGFTDYQVDRSYVRDLDQLRQARADLTAQYAKQRAEMTGETARAADQQYISQLEKIDTAIGGTAAKLQNLRMTFDEQTLKGFNPTSILTQLQASTSALQNMGATIQGDVVSAVDDLGESLGRAIVGGEDLGEALQQVVFDSAGNIFTDMFKTGVNGLAQSGIKALTGDNGTGQKEASTASTLLGGLFGMGGEGTSTGSMTVTAGSVTVIGSRGGVPVVPGGDGGTGVGVGEQGGGLLDAIGEKLGGLGSGIDDMFGGVFSSLKNSLSGLFGGLGDMLGGLLGGGGGGGGGGSGSWLGTIAKIGMSYYTGGASMAFASGGMPSRMIKGRPSAQRDNLSATAVVGGKPTPIRVEANEGILNRSAMAAIGGEKGLRALNTGAMPGFAVGGKPVSGYNAKQPVTTGQDSMANTVRSAVASNPAAKGDSEVNIANIYSDQGFADFVSSRTGRRVIINELKKEGVI